MLLDMTYVIYVVRNLHGDPIIREIGKDDWRLRLSSRAAGPMAGHDEGGRKTEKKRRKGKQAKRDLSKNEYLMI